MAGWYVVAKKIGGRRYFYRQRTWREGSLVKTESQYIAPADGVALAVRPTRPKFAPLGEDAVKELWLKGELTGSPLQLDERFLATLKKYTGSLAGKLNRGIRYDGPMHPGDGYEILKLKKALGGPVATVQKDLVLFRATQLPKHRVSVGKIFSDEAFMSFSVSLTATDKFSKEPRRDYERVVLRLEAREGEKGYLQLSLVSSFIPEYELVRGKGRFIIFHIEAQEDRKICYIREVEEVRY